MFYNLEAWSSVVRYRIIAGHFDVRQSSLPAYADRYVDLPDTASGGDGSFTVCLSDTNQLSLYPAYCTCTNWHVLTSKIQISLHNRTV